MAKREERAEFETRAGADGRQWVVYLQLTTAMAFFGMSFVFTSLALQELRPISIIFFRLVVSLAALLLFSRIPAVIRIIGRPRIPRPKDRGIFACVALFQPFMYFLAENTGLLYASPAVAAIIIATIPIVTPVATFLLMRERLTARVVIGALASFAGVALIVLAGGEAGGAAPLGVLLIFGAVLAAVGYAIAVKRVPREYGAFTLVIWQNLIGVCLFLPLLLIFDVPQLLDTGLPSLEVLGAIAFLGVFPSTLSFIFLGRGIRILGPTKANLMANTVPIFAVVFSVAVLGETIRGVTLVGMVIVIAGVLLGQVRRNRVRPAATVGPADVLVAKRGDETNARCDGADYANRSEARRSRTSIKHDGQRSDEESEAVDGREDSSPVVESLEEARDSRAADKDCLDNVEEASSLASDDDAPGDKQEDSKQRTREEPVDGT